MVRALGRLGILFIAFDARGTDVYLVPGGTGRVNFARFVIFTFVGRLSGASAVFGGYILGSNWESLRNAMSPFDLPIAAILVLLIVYYIYRHVRHSRTDEPLIAGE